MLVSRIVPYFYMIERHILAIHEECTGATNSSESGGLFAIDQA
jgi:hypothetical protein